MIVTLVRRLVCCISFLAMGGKNRSYPPVDVDLDVTKSCLYIGTRCYSKLRPHIYQEPLILKVKILDPRYRMYPVTPQA